MSFFSAGKYNTDWTSAIWDFLVLQHWTADIAGPERPGGSKQRPAKVGSPVLARPSVQGWHSGVGQRLGEEPRSRIDGQEGSLDFP